MNVPDQFAGTLMKCPLCAAPITVPALPPKAGPVPPVPPGPPPGPPPAAAVPPAAITAAAPAPAPSLPPSTGDYRGGFSFPIDPRVLQWLAAGAIVLAFLLQLIFPLLGLYPGGYAVYTQGTFQAAIGWHSTSDPVWLKWLSEHKEFSTIDLTGDSSTTPPTPPKVEPSWSLPTLLYWLLLLPTVIVVVGSAVLPYVNLRLPPAVDKVKEWRWALAGGLALIGFLLLTVQLLTGFSLEQRISDEAEVKAREVTKLAQTPPDKLDDRDRQYIAMTKTSLIGGLNLRHTSALRLVYFLQLLTAASAGLVFWAQFRPNRPYPRIDVRW
jgi:hypothetical protein